MVFEGVYAPEDAFAAIDGALDLSDAVAAGLLLDLTASRSFRDRSAPGLRRVAEFLATRRARFSSRLATVGASDLAFGLLRMGMVFTSDQGIETEVFRTHEEALVWLRGGGVAP